MSSYTCKNIFTRIEFPSTIRARSVMRIIGWNKRNISHIASSLLYTLNLLSSLHSLNKLSMFISPIWFHRLRFVISLTTAEVFSLLIHLWRFAFILKFYSLFLHIKLFTLLRSSSTSVFMLCNSIIIKFAPTVSALHTISNFVSSTAALLHSCSSWYLDLHYQFSDQVYSLKILLLLFQLSMKR